MGARKGPGGRDDYSDWRVIQGTMAMEPLGPTMRAGEGAFAFESEFVSLHYGIGAAATWP